MNDYRDLLSRLTEPFGVEISPELWEKFAIYGDLLKEWNEKINLTAITEDNEITVKHFADSLTALKFMSVKNGTTLADIGTGAGFPGLPLKIAAPGLNVTLVDSLEKRLNFLETVISELGLTGITTVHARAEDFGRNPAFRDSFDYATARAVAAMPVLLEYCMPAVKKGGCFLALKGSRDEGEFKRAAALLSARPVRTEEFTIQNGGELLERKIYIFEKTDRTAKAYPRKAGTPGKNPL